MNKTGATTASFIVPISTLLIITLLCIGGVEGFYYLLGTYLRPEKQFVDQPVSRQHIAQQAMSGDPADSGGEPSLIDSDISVITSRNLFGSRVGDAPALWQQDPLEGLEASSLDIVLMGTVTTDAEDDQRAVIYDGNSGRQELYQKGDYIQQAAVKQIMRGKVILTIDGRDEMLDISQAREVAVVPPVQMPEPVTTTQQVIGRPVGSSSSADEKPRQRQTVEPNGDNQAVILQEGGAQLLRPIRK